MKQFDIIIIGCGISGLYTAYKIKKYNPNISFLILEKNKNIGGRMGNYDFYGQSVVIGAGIGRKEKDKNLLSLLDELHIKTNEFTVQKQFGKSIKNPVNIMNIIRELRGEYHKYEIAPNTTFKEFGIKHLGKKMYNNFLECAGFRDFENADIYETLYKYGFDDNTPNWIGVGIPWNELLEKLVAYIGKEHILTNENIVKINKNDTDNDNTFIIKTEHGREFSSKKVVIATRSDTVQKLLKNICDKNIYKNIQGQTFLRLYGKFSGKSLELMKNVVPVQTNVSNHLQKILPINKEKGIYMITYSDNKCAKSFKNRLENNKENRIFWCKELEKALFLPNNSLKLDGIKAFYWPIGTHYYKPLPNIYKNRKEFIDKAQHPTDGIVVVGEMISRDQGWTEGALKSVDLAVTKKFMCL